MVASLDTGDALSNALHNARSLMPQNAGKQALWVCTQAVASVTLCGWRSIPCWLKACANSPECSNASCVS